MRALVTGGAGFIGSHIVDGLLQRGYSVRVFDRLKPPVHTGSWPDYLSPDVDRVHGDIADHTALRSALQNVDIVFHMAAYQDYLTDFSQFYRTNCVGSALLYELIVTEHLPVQKVVIASTQAMYGEGKYRCAEHGVVFPDQRQTAQLEASDWSIRCPVCRTPVEPQWTDEAVVRPHNSYAMSKRTQEELALTLGRRYEVPTVALRFSIVQGPRQSFRNAYSGALRAFAVRVLSGQPPVMYEDGEQIRDFVSIHDVVRACLLVLDTPRADYRALNVGAARQVTVRTLAELVVRESGRFLEPTAPGLYRVGDTRHIFSDVSALEALGWRSTVSQEDMVREYLAWVAEQPGLHDTFGPAQVHMQQLGVLKQALVHS